MNTREAILLHLAGFLGDGKPLPKKLATSNSYVEDAAFAIRLGHCRSGLRQIGDEAARINGELYGLVRDTGVFCSM